MHLTPNGCVTNRFEMLEYYRCMLHFQIGLRLALGRDLLFLR